MVDDQLSLDRLGEQRSGVLVPRPPGRSGAESAERARTILAGIPLTVTGALLVIATH
jgi:hypothetical protein